MITPLLFMTVSAFSTPLLENSSYNNTTTTCTLRVKEEHFQEKIILAMSSNRDKQFDIKIYHFNDLAAPSVGKLTQEPIFNTAKNDINYIVAHNFFKRIDNNNVIYSTTITNDSIGPQLFIDTFRDHGNRSRVHIEGLDHPLAFVADHQQAQRFYACTNSFAPKEETASAPEPALAVVQH